MKRRISEDEGDDVLIINNAKRLLEDLYSSNDLTKDFPTWEIDRWVKFYREFVVDNNGEQIKSVVTKLKKVPGNKIPCLVYLIRRIWIDIEGVETGEWESTFFEKKVHNFSQFNYAINLCCNIKNTINDVAKDCWLCSQINNSGYPQVHFTETEVRLLNKQQGTRILRVVDNPIDRQILAHRWACSLKCNGIDYDDRDKQAAHRCFNKNCFNPRHMKKSTDKDNKDDKGCKYGHAHFCPHVRRCIWTSENTGRWLPCRNDETKAISKQDCTHNPKKCYT